MPLGRGTQTGAPHSFFVASPWPGQAALWLAAVPGVCTALRNSRGLHGRAMGHPLLVARGSSSNLFSSSGCGINIWWCKREEERRGGERAESSPETFRVFSPPPSTGPVLLSACPALLAPGVWPGASSRRDPATRRTGERWRVRDPAGAGGIRQGLADFGAGSPAPAARACCARRGNHVPTERG